MSKKDVIAIYLLYHGTLDKYAADIIANGIDLTKSKKHLDFGPGFYTTPDLEFAIETARSRAKSYNFFHSKEEAVTPKVLVFECNEVLFDKLTKKSFDEADFSWGQFILANRCENQIVHEQYDNNICSKYDVVSGPTADGKGTLTPIVEEVNRNSLAIEGINVVSFAPAKHRYWGKQISFHTTHSLSCIRLKRVL